MGQLMKLIIFATMLNAVFYAAINLVQVPAAYGDSGPDDYVSLSSSLGVKRLEPDLLSLFYGGNVSKLVTDSQEDWTSYPEANQSLVTVPNQASGEALGTDIVNFLDPLKIPYALFNTVLNVGFGPLVLFTSNKIDPIYAFIIGVPYAIFVLFGIVFAIRSGDTS